MASSPFPRVAAFCFLCQPQAALAQQAAGCRLWASPMAAGGLTAPSAPLSASECFGHGPDSGQAGQGGWARAGAPQLCGGVRWGSWRPWPWDRSPQVPGGAAESQGLAVTAPLLPRAQGPGQGWAGWGGQAWAGGRSKPPSSVLSWGILGPRPHLPLRTAVPKGEWAFAAPQGHAMWWGEA